LATGQIEKVELFFIGNLAMYWRHARIYSLNMAISASFYFPSKCGEFGGGFSNVEQVCDWTPNTQRVFDWVYIYIYMPSYCVFGICNVSMSLLFAIFLFFKFNLI
jgi:hypothetical protein